MWPMLGMTERCQKLCFPPEAGEPFAVGGEGLPQNLQRHVAIELRVAGAVDLAHAARANQRDDLVGAETSAGLEGHRCGGLYVLEVRHHTHPERQSPRAVGSIIRPAVALGSQR
jgi:hypothetical protein